MSTKYKKLCLDKRKIIPCVHSFFKNLGISVNVSEPTQVNPANKYQYRVSISYPENQLEFDLYFSEKIKVTLANQKKIDIIDDLFDYIIENAKFQNLLPNQGTYLTLEEFEFFKETLEKDYNLKFTCCSNSSDLKVQIYDVSGPFLDYAKISYFNSSKLLFQGSPLYIFENIAYVLSILGKIELSDEIVEPISIDTLEIELRSKLPAAYTHLSQNMKNTLMKPLWHLHLDSSPLDYSHVDFYTCRVVEGQIRTIAARSNVRPQHPRDPFADYHNLNFLKKTEDGRTYYIDHPNECKMPDKDKLHIIELYKTFWNKRNQIMHEAENFDGLYTESKEEAYHNFNELLMQIDRYYSIV